MPTYNELVLVANADGLEQEGPKIRRFIGALSRGVRDLERDQSSAIEGLLKANPDLDPALQRASVRSRCPSSCRPRGSRMAGRSPAEWSAFATWMHQNGILKGSSAVRAFTNEFLPGQGL